MIDRPDLLPCPFCGRMPKQDTADGTIHCPSSVCSGCGWSSEKSWQERIFSDRDLSLAYEQFESSLRTERQARAIVEAENEKMRVIYNATHAFINAPINIDGIAKFVDFVKGFWEIK